MNGLRKLIEELDLIGPAELRSGDDEVAIATQRPAKASAGELCRSRAELFAREMEAIVVLRLVGHLGQSAGVREGDAKTVHNTGDHHGRRCGLVFVQLAAGRKPTAGLRSQHPADLEQDPPGMHSGGDRIRHQLGHMIVGRHVHLP